MTGVFALGAFAAHFPLVLPSEHNNANAVQNDHQRGDGRSGAGIKSRN